MKKKSMLILSFLLGQSLFAQGSQVNALFTQKDVAQIAAAVEFREFLAEEELISCKNFRMRLKEANFKNEETKAAVTAEEFRYVLDHTKSYMGFYDYHALTRLQLRFKLPQGLDAKDPTLVKTLEMETLKVVYSGEDFLSFKVSQYKVQDDELSFDIDLNLADLCLEKGVKFSLYKDCESTDLAELDCQASVKYSFVTGPLEIYHPTNLRLEKTRLSELGLGGDHE
jgi:hypothetical protein